MFRTGPTLTSRIRSEQEGFTLVELLVVMLIIAALAGIAVGILLGQEVTGQDAAAKSDAINLVTQVESCYVDQHDYRQCTPSGNSIAGSQTGLQIGTSAGQVSASAGSTNDITVIGYSKSGNTFTVQKTGASPFTRTCSVGPRGNKGACQSSGSW